jgi:hypothetical protein
MEGRAKAGKEVAGGCLGLIWFELNFILGSRVSSENGIDIDMNSKSKPFTQWLYRTRSFSACPACHDA